MNKRDFLAAAATASVLPAATAPAVAKPTGRGPVLLTVAGAIARKNRGPIDSTLDQMMIRHGLDFKQAFTFDATVLHRLPKISIRPTLEYDSKPHTLTGPLLTTVLDETGIKNDPALRIGLRAVDGYNVTISVEEARSYRMIVATDIDGTPLALGGLGPQWAVYEADTIAVFRSKPVKERFALCPWGLYFIEVGVR
jgi:hypothetical protein